MATKEALETLEGAMLVSQVVPTSSLGLPLVEKPRTARKLLPLDIGLAMFEHGRSPTTTQGSLLGALAEGRFAECVVGQQLLSDPTMSPPRLHYWVRQKRKSDAEVDFVIAHEGRLLPIEVKQGKTGTLRSLHQLMGRAQLSEAVRLYSGEFDDRLVQAPFQGATISFRLRSLPIYLAETLVSSSTA